MLKWIYSILLLSVLGIAHSPNPANAQTVLPCTVSFVWQTTTGTPNGVSFFEQIGSGSVTSLTRNNNQWLRYSSTSPGSYRFISQVYEPNQNCVPSSVAFVWRRETPNESSAWIETSLDGLNWTTRVANTVPAGGSGNVNIILTWNNTTGQSFRYVRCRVGSPYPVIQTFVINAVSAPDFVRPLQYLHETDFTTVQPSGNTLFTAVRPFLPVHAPFDATVSSITPMDSDDCTSLGMQSSVCATMVQSGAHRVVLDIDGDDYTYLLSDATTYLEDGMSISEGCIMGESTQLIGHVVTTVPLSYLARYPSDTAQPCKDSPPPDNCLNDSLGNGESWYRQGTVTWGNEVVLGVGGRIYQIVTIPANARARLIVTAKNGTAYLALGTSNQSFTIPNEFLSVQIPYGDHEPNLVDFYEVSVRNTGETDLTVSAICLEIDEPDDDNKPKTVCVFENYTFDKGINSWSISGDVIPITGALVISDGGGVAQFAYLIPNEYTLFVDFGLDYDVGFDLSTNGSEPVLISYMFPFASTPDYVDFPSLTIADIGDNLNYRTAVNIPIATLTQGDFYIEFDTPDIVGMNGVYLSRICLVPSNGDWGDNPPSDDGLPFDEACESLSYPRGNDISQWVSWHWHSLNQFFQCDLMRNLNNTYGLLRWFQAMFMLFMNWLGDMGTWINGHVQNLIYAITHSDELKEWQMPTNVASGGVWSMDGFSLPSGMSGIQSEPDMPMFEGESCNWHDFFCHGRNIVGGVVNFAGGVINDVASVLVNFIGALLAQIVDLITWGYRQFIEPIMNLWNDFWALIGQVKETIELIFEGENNLITMWNETEPLPPPGLEDCSIQPETKTLCLVFWVSENTLFEGDWGIAIIGLITSILGVFGLMIIIQNFMALVETAKNA